VPYKKNSIEYEKKSYGMRFADEKKLMYINKMGCIE
jgi:hypothetical protein